MDPEVLRQDLGKKGKKEGGEREKEEKKQEKGDRAGGKREEADKEGRMSWAG